MQVLIPAGGRGVRLRPLTTLCPKPLLPLGDRPILSRIIERLPGATPIHVMITAALEAPFHAWRETMRQPEIQLFTEGATETATGPVWAISDCVRSREIDDDLLIVMGDSLLPFTAEEFLRTANLDQLRIGIFRLDSIADAGRYGVVEWNERDGVTSFIEKPARPRSPWVFMGCLYIPQRLLQRMHRIADERPGQMGELVARFLAAGEPVSTFTVHNDWHDIGTFSAYLEAHRAFVSPSQHRFLAESGNDLDGIVYVHPSAKVSGSLLRNCIVHNGAEIRNAVLTDCVVHPSVSVIGRTAAGMLLSQGEEMPFYRGANV